MKRNSISFLCAASAALCVTSATAGREWSGAAGLDLADAANWTETSADGHWFKTDAEGLTLAADGTFADVVTVNKDGIRLTFDIGRDRALRFGSNYFCDANDATVEFLSGTYESTSGKDFVPLSSSNWGVRKQRNVFRLKGKDTHFKANGRFMLSYNSNFGTFEMDDGATFVGQLSFGNANPKDMTVNVLNGSALTNAEVCSFFGNDRTRTTVSNATFTVRNGWNFTTEGGQDAWLGIREGGRFTIENGPLFVNGVRAKVVVDGPGGTMSAMTAYIGMKKYGEATLTVSNGGRAEFLRGVNLGGRTSTSVDDQGNAVASVSNLLHVTSGGVLVCGGQTYVDEALTIGDFWDKSNANAVQGNAANGGSRVLIEDGGIVSNTTWYSTLIGNMSSSNCLEVTSGGRFDSVGPIRLGAKAASCGNVLRVVDGGVVAENGSGLWIGYEGSSNLCEVANATMTVGNGNQTVYVGFTNCTGNVLRILPGGRLLGQRLEDSETRYGYVYLGYAANTEAVGGRDGRLEVLGGELSVNHLQVGVNGSSGNTLIVSNGTIEVGYFALAHSQTQNKLVLKGTSPEIRVDGTGNVLSAGEVVFDFADGVCEKAPLHGVGMGKWRFADGTKVRFENVGLLPESKNHRCELVRNDETEIEISDATLAEWRKALPERCRLHLSADRKRLTFTASRAGLAIVIR